VAQQPTHLVVGHVSRAHGTRGEVYVSPLTDHPESVFAPGVVLRVAADEGEKPDPKLPPLTIESVRPFRDGVLVTFDVVPDRNAAERLQHRYLVAPLSDLAELVDDELFYHQLLGMRVRTLDGNEIGEVQEVYELQPAHMLEVRGPGGTFLVPLTARIVRDVNAEEGWMVIDPPEGLLDL
jgi:16S rRNA processing protein RimM